MYDGGCLCGAVRFEMAGSIKNIVFCHCAQCRKAQGSAFAANGIVDAEQFAILTGEPELTEFEPSPGQTKIFCGNCDSPIISKSVTKPDQVWCSTRDYRFNYKRETASPHICFVKSKLGKHMRGFTTV